VKASPSETQVLGRERDHPRTNEVRNDRHWFVLMYRGSDRIGRMIAKPQGMIG